MIFAAGVACLPESNEKNARRANAPESSPHLGQVGGYHIETPRFSMPASTYSMESNAHTDTFEGGRNSKHTIEANAQDVGNSKGTKASAALILEEMKGQRQADLQKENSCNYESSHLSRREASAHQELTRSYKQGDLLRLGESENEFGTGFGADSTEQSGVPMNQILEDVRSEAEEAQRKLLYSGIDEASLNNLGSSEASNSKVAPLSTIAGETVARFREADAASTHVTYTSLSDNRADTTDPDQPANFMLPLQMLPHHIYQPRHFMPPEYQPVPSSYAPGALYNPLGNMQYMATQNAPLTPYATGPVVPFAYPYGQMPFPHSSSAILKNDPGDLSEFHPTTAPSWSLPFEDHVSGNMFPASNQTERPYRKRQRKISKSETCCQQCGATSTPEWRKGPEGSRTLCNACGLFHAKMCRKRGEVEALRLLKERQASSRT